MAKLDVNRMADSTKLSRVDNAHVALEADLETILGVPDNTVITSPIFGVTPDGSAPVQSDGSLKGVMRFYESGVISDASDASGFEFTDGNKTKRLVMVSSGLKIYELVGSAWTVVADLEHPGSGSGTFAALADVDPSMSPNDGDLIEWVAASSHWSSVAPASGSGKTRFADLDDTPAAANPAPGDPFNAADVGKLVYVASTTTLGFQAAPAGVGAPFCMMLKAPGSGTSTWGSTTTAWIDVYQWDYESFTDDGGFLTDDPNLLTNDGGKANKFVSLDAGLYHITLWYTCTNPTKWGSRQWKISGSNSDGPATYGIQQEANLFWQTGLPPDENPATLPGIHFLGSAMLIQFADGTIKFQVQQDSGFIMSGVVFYAVITKVK